MFRTVPLSIIRRSPLYTQQWYMSHRFADSLWAESGWDWVLDSSSVRHQEFPTVHTAMVYVIQVCWQLVSRIRMGLSFGQFLCPSSGVPHCTNSNAKCHTGLLTACEQDQDGTEFWTAPLSIIRSSPLYIQQWYMSYRFADSLWAGSGCRIRLGLSPILILQPHPVYKLSANLYVIYHCCVYSDKLLMMERRTVRNM